MKPPIFRGPHYIISVFAALLLAVGARNVAGQTAPAALDNKPTPAAKATPVPVAPRAGYDVSVLPANIALTSATRKTPVNVVGQPHDETKHPNIFWDQGDVDHYKEMLKTSKELQIQFEVLKARADVRLQQPIALGPPQKGPDGKWIFPGNYVAPYPGAPATDDPNTRLRRYYNTDSEDVSNLGTVYALTGDQKYADYAKKLLLSWAHCYEWGACTNVRLRSGQGVFGQIFDEALIMDHFVRGYDLIYNIPSWTEVERKQLYAEFFYPMACIYLYPAAPDIDKEDSGGAFVSQLNNRGMITLTGVLAMGYASGDPQLIAAGLYGIHTPLKKPDNSQFTEFPPRQDWYVGTADHPGHGMLNTFFGEPAIPGGMWVEGTVAYTFYVMGSMIDSAEMAWHHGVDLYRNNNGIFKDMFDFPIVSGYPDLTTPGLNDGHRDSLLGGSAQSYYEYAYRRYQDPRYLAMINPPKEREYLAALRDPAMAAQIEELALHPPKPVAGATPTPVVSPAPTPLPKSGRSLELARIGSVPPNFMYDLDPNAGATIPPSPSVNYDVVGYGILRTPALDGKSVQSLILSSGPSASHGHPDKLQIDLYALDDVLMPSPGINFPYNGNTRIARWYHTTVAHNTLTVDEQSQVPFGSGAKTNVHADQVVFAPASTVGMERAWSNSAYPGVTMDRAVFMTPEYLADLFGAFSTTPHKYDLAWHIRGDVSSSLAFSPMTFDPTIMGYCTLTNVRQAAADKAWSVNSMRGDHVAHLLGAPVAGTKVITGDSGFYVDDTSSDPTHKPTCPTILERRENATSTVYGTALDFSNLKDGYVKSVTEQGGLETGYGLLEVTTKSGTDLCFAAYRPGVYKAGALTTDALQAFVQMDGANVKTMYLAGGKSLRTANAGITREPAGLAYVEKALDGNYIVGNPSPTDATVSVMLPTLTGRAAFALDANGQKGAAVSVKSAGGALTVPLKAGGQVVFVGK